MVRRSTFSATSWSQAPESSRMKFLLVLSIWPATRPTAKKLSKARANRRGFRPADGEGRVQEFSYALRLTPPGRGPTVAPSHSGRHSDRSCDWPAADRALVRLPAQCAGPARDCPAGRLSDCLFGLAQPPSLQSEAPAPLSLRRTRELCRDPPLGGILERAARSGDGARVERAAARRDPAAGRPSEHSGGALRRGPRGWLGRLAALPARHLAVAGPAAPRRPDPPDHARRSCLRSHLRADGVRARDGDDHAGLANVSHDVRQPRLRPRQCLRLYGQPDHPGAGAPLFPAALRPRGIRGVKSGKRRRRTLWLTVAGVLVAAYFLAPFSWLVLTSFMHESDAMAVPPRWLPDRPTLVNYATFAAPGGTRSIVGSRAAENTMPSIVNSLVAATGTAALNLALGILAGYSFARLRFPGRRTLLFLYLGSRMVPGIALIVPLYLVIKTLGPPRQPAGPGDDLPHV